MTENEKLKNFLKRSASDLSGYFSEAEGPCPDSTLLSAFLEGKLEEEKARQVAHHVLSCKICSEFVLAQQAVEEEEPQEEALLYETKAERSSSALPFLRRYRLQAAILAAAACLLLAFLFLPKHKPITFEAEIQSPAGALRSTVLSSGQTVILKVSTPKEAYTYVFAYGGESFELLYPEKVTEQKPLKGTAFLPSKDFGWKLEDFEPGKYAFLIGLSDKPLGPGELKKAQEKLNKCENKFSESQLKASLKDTFRAFKLLPFKIAPQ